jgi:hypothetical protein
MEVGTPPTEAAKIIRAQTAGFWETTWAQVQAMSIVEDTLDYVSNMIRKIALLPAPTLSDKGYQTYLIAPIPFYLGGVDSPFVISSCSQTITRQVNRIDGRLAGISNKANKLSLSLVGTKDNIYILLLNALIKMALSYEDNNHFRFFYMSPTDFIKDGILQTYSTVTSNDTNRYEINLEIEDDTIVTTKQTASAENGVTKAIGLVGP